MRLFRALISCCLAATFLACGSSGPNLEKVEVPTSKYVDLGTEEQAQVREAIVVIEDSDADPEDRAEAYILVSDANLYVWDRIQQKAENLDESQGGEFKEMTRYARIYFMQAHRARARAWRERAKASPEYVEGGVFESRFADGWKNYDEPQRAYDQLTQLLGEVILARQNRYIDVDFLSDLRYSAAIFYTLLDKPAGDMNLLMEICQQNEAEAVRFAGDVAFLYEKLVTKPESAAETYRSIAQAKPKTREGYEAQVSVLEALEKQRVIGALESGSSDEFDTSSEGVALFQRVDKDLDVLVEMNTHRDKWTEDLDDSNLDARAEDLVRTFTVRMHGLAQQQDSPTFYEMAVNAYDKYHQLFPTSGYAYEMLYFHAEALYELGRYGEAYQRYKEALGTQAQGKYREDIVRALVMTGYKRTQEEPLPSAPPDRRVDMPAAHRDFIGSGEQFIVVLGDKDPEMAGYIKYEIAKRHYLYGETRVAEPILDEFLRYDGDHSEAPKAAQLYLDIWAREALRGGDREYRALERAVEKVRSVPSLATNSDVQKKIEDVLQKPPVVGSLP